MSKKLQERKKKAKEKAAKEKVLRRREAIRKQAKKEHEDTQAQKLMFKGVPIVGSVEDHKKAIFDKLQHNLEILKALEEEYNREQELRKAANSQLESEGHTTLREKMDALNEKAQEEIGVQNLDQICDCGNVKMDTWIGGNNSPRRIEKRCPACDGHTIGQISD